MPPKKSGAAATKKAAAAPAHGSYLGTLKPNISTTTLSRNCGDSFILVACFY